MIITSSKQTAKFFQVHMSTLSRWRQVGAKGYLQKNQWDLTELFKWWLENIQNAGPVKDQSGLAQARERYWRGKAEMCEIQAARLKGEMIPIEEIEKKWAARVAVVCAGLELLSSRLPGLLAGKSRQEMALIIKKEVWMLREAYAGNTAV